MRVFIVLILAQWLLLGASAGRTDAEIESDLKARLSRSKLASSGFQVHVKGGVATLTGQAAIVQHKGIATRMAKASGASRVDNQIRISPEGRRQAMEQLARGRHKDESPAPAKAPPPSEKSASAQVPAQPAFVPPPVRRAQIRH